MKREEYIKNRTGLLQKAEKALNNGEMEEYNQAVSEINALDERYQAEATAEANLEALKEPFALAIPGVTGDGFTNEGEATVDYAEAFALKLMGKPLTNEHINSILEHNENLSAENLGASDAPMIIPETTMGTIYKKMREKHPILRDTMPTNIKGSVTVIVDENTDEDADWYDDDTATKSGDPVFGEVNLKGYDLSRIIPIKWNMKEQSVEGFLNYISEKVAEKMGNALAKGWLYGKGVAGKEDTFKSQPLGAMTAIESETDTPQIIEFAEATGITYKNITEAISLCSGANVVKIYANRTTIWKHLANIVDTNKRAIFIPDPVRGGVGSILGLIVEEESSVSDDSVVFGDFKDGYASNINKDITIMTDEDVTNRLTKYVGYAIADGSPKSNKAFVEIKKAATTTG